MKFKLLCLFLAGVLLGSFVTYLRAAPHDPASVHEFAPDRDGILHVDEGRRAGN